MFYLKYSTKNEDGKYITTKLYPSADELDQMRSALAKPIRPPSMLFRGQLLRTAGIEILDDTQNDSDEREHLKNRYDAVEDREVIRAFEREFIDWSAHQPEGQRSIYHYCSHLGLAQFESFEIAHRGEERVLRPAEYGDFWKKWSALCDLRFRRSKAEKIEKRALESMELESRERADQSSLLPESEERPAKPAKPLPEWSAFPVPADDEIDASQIPF